MVFDPKEFYTLATSLIDNRTNEATYRTAISRTYYAAHLLARERLRMTRRNWESTGGGDHDKVIRDLRPGRTRILSELINTLRRYREHVDYHLEPTESIINEKCEHRRHARTSSQAHTLVNERQWNDVREVSNRLFPLLERL